MDGVTKEKEENAKELCDTIEAEKEAIDASAKADSAHKEAQSKLVEIKEKMKSL